jgi:hypothetical protein
MTHREEADGSSGTGPPDGGTDPDHASHPELTRDQEIGYYIEIWKHTVDTQMHFNDIEWRIRGLALTVATFALGAAGVAAKDGSTVGWFSLGSLVLVIGLLLWYAFYFVDRVWYHPLLKGAVDKGTEIEEEIKKSLPRVGMTATITDRSRYETGRIVRVLSRKKVMRSDDKLVWFYRVGAVALAAAALALQVGVLVGTDDVSEEPTNPADQGPIEEHGR